MLLKDKYLMDGHKLLWHLDRVKNWEKGEKISPLHIDLGITTGCNLACKYCYGVLQGRTGYGTDAHKRFDMPKEALIRLMHDSKEIGIKSIAYIGEGENTLNPALYDGLSAAKEISLDVSLATNGILIKNDKIQNMLSALSWLRVNISAATPKSYSEIHQSHPKIFDKVVKNIEKLVETRTKEGFNTTLGMQMIITKENMDQVVPLAKLGRDLGVDYSVFKPCSDTIDKKLDSPDKEYLQMDNIFEEAENFSTGNYNVVIKRTKLKNLGLKDYKKCYGTNFIIAISGNGNVFPCGHWFNIRSEEFLMGNIIDNSLERIVKSQRYWDVQKKISEKVNVNQDCESNCRQHYINQFLWRIKQGKINLNNLEIPDEIPKHVNFI